MTHRRLPDIYAEGTPLFLTWSLHGVVRPSQARPPAKLTAGEAFAWLDRKLDQARTGPTYLSRPDIANLVIDSIGRGESLRHYELDAYVVMPNHVHLLILPRVQPDVLLKYLRAATSREANRILGRPGDPFWQKESYNHWVRSAEELVKIRTYIHNNPVKAGLVAMAEAYPWSTAGVARSLGAASVTPNRMIA
jgi:putative transposase